MPFGPDRSKLVPLSLPPQPCRPGLLELLVALGRPAAAPRRGRDLSCLRRAAVWVLPRSWLALSGAACASSALAVSPVLAAASSCSVAACGCFWGGLRLFPHWSCGCG
jgi:hypothetical protein